jgi:hypothetical protein
MVLEEVILDQWEIRHSGMSHRGEIIIAILCHHDVASPGSRLLEKATALRLDVFSDIFIDREGHAVTGDSWIKDDVGSSKLLGHTVQDINHLKAQP